MTTDYAREIDRYWSAEAARAYEERRMEIREALKASGGQIEPWMQYQIRPDHLASELRPYQ